MLFSKDGIKSLHCWTHECLDLLIDHAANLSDEQFLREIPGFGAACVRDQLVHVIASEAGWVRRLQYLRTTRWHYENYGTIASLLDAKRKVTGDSLTYLEGLSEVQLNADLEPVPEEWLGPTRSPGFVLHHVLTHSFHHKGQITAMFRLLGHPAPDTDLLRAP